MGTTHTFFVLGMHCDACVLLTESELMDVPGITRARSSLVTCTVDITGEFGEREPRAIAEELTGVLAKHGYSLSVERPSSTANWGEFAYAAPIALVFMLGFFALQKAGLVDLITVNSVSYGTAFFVGIVASLSTCMAVVGGLLLSMSATFAKSGDKVRPQVLFHVARIATFFILGGAIGSLGSLFQMSATASLVLSLAIGAVMLALGLNLMDVFVATRRLRVAMPRFVSMAAMTLKEMNHSLTPVLVGVTTFFLPCGFTQSMQVYTLSTGSFMTGGLTMLAFALGTLPVLSLISFSSFSVEKSRHKGVFFKTAGMIVIAFAAFIIVNALAAAGVIRPFFTM
jgi:sulfite exporter TauE/SafE/copper chaperone CopZ